jgi:hypothetical protein
VARPKQGLYPAWVTQRQRVMARSAAPRAECGAVVMIPAVLPAVLVRPRRVVRFLAARFQPASGPAQCQTL